MSVFKRKKQIPDVDAADIPLAEVEEFTRQALAWTARVQVVNDDDPDLAGIVRDKNEEPDA